MTKYDKIVLGVDVGGTNINFTVIGIKNRRFEKLFYQHEDTSVVDNFSQLVNRFIKTAKNQGFTLHDACISVAGPVENYQGYQRVKMTNAALVIDSKRLIKSTSLRKVLLINDFEAISYAINILTKKDVKVLNKGLRGENQVCAVLGAGTGLGKSILYYNSKTQAYLPLPSEGGHADFPLFGEEDNKIKDYITQKKRKDFPISYEDVLSGRGLETIYGFLAQTQYRDMPRGLSAQEISETRKINLCSKKTFEVFIRYYARCARNFVLDVLARGGLYIAGGIAAKNSDSFKDFMNEFVKNKAYGDILQKVPVSIITNYDISPYGAAFALTLQEYI